MDSKGLAFAVARFPKLKNIGLYASRSPHRKLQSTRDYYGERLGFPKGVDCSRIQVSQQEAGQLDDIWKAISKSNARLHLEKLGMDSVSMGAFDIPILAEAAYWPHITKSLRRMGLAIDVKRNGAFDSVEENSYFRSMMDHNQLYKFLHAAQRLEVLHLWFKMGYVRVPADTSNIFGTNTWTNLKVLFLQMASSSSRKLVEILSRHQALDDVTLESHNFEEGDYLRICGEFLLAVGT